MNVRTLLALCVAICSPLVAAAAETPAPSPPGMPSAATMARMMDIMRSFAPQERQIARELRSQVLAVIGPADRAAIAAAFGNYAVSPSLDRDSLSARLDSLLSPAERQAVAARFTAFQTQENALHDKVEAAIVREFPEMENGRSQASQAPEPLRAADAGKLLAATLVSPQVGTSAAHSVIATAPQPAVQWSMLPPSAVVGVQMQTAGEAAPQQGGLRATVLAALLPAQRAAIAHAIGSYAVSTNADIAAVAQEIDAVLSPAQRQQIVAGYAARVAQQQSDRQRMLEQMKRDLPADAYAQFSQTQSTFGSPPPSRPPTAGEIAFNALLFPPLAATFSNTTTNQ